MLRRGIAEPMPADLDKGLARGVWMEGGRPTSGKKAAEGSQALIAHSPSFRKQAAVGVMNGGVGSTAGAPVERLAPEVYSPLFVMANLNLPRDRITVNAWCFLPGTMVWMADGTRKPIEEICVGDMVLSGEGLPRRVTTVFRRHVDEEIVGLRVKNSQETVWCTTNHGFNAVKADAVRCHDKTTFVKCKPDGDGCFCSRCGRKDDPYVFGKVESGQLGERDILYMPVPKLEPVSNDPLLSNPEAIELLGYYAAEGFVAHNRVTFSLGSHEKQLAVRIEELVGKLFAEGQIHTRSDRSTEIYVDCSNAKLAAFVLRHCGQGSLTKRLSFELMSVEPGLLLRFLVAWLDGDGGQEKYNSGIFVGNTSSENLAWQMRMLCLRCGLVAHVFRAHSQKTMVSPTNGETYPAAPRYYVKIRGKSALKLAECFSSEFYRFAAIERSYERDGCCFIHKDKAIQWINTVKRSGYIGFVHNIEVEIDHTYVVGYGVSVRNCRNFFDLHPLVRNAITMHATYPISKISIRCQDKKVQQFFEDMIEEMDLLGALGDISLEYWKLGEAFPYAELDENTLKWKRIVVQNPDYIHVKKMVIASEPVISLRPDAVLQRLVMSNNPADVQLRKQIPQHIVYHVRRGENIPLDNFNVSHLKMLSSPYDVRGTSVIVAAFKDLMLYDKIRECFSIDSEIMTERGFKTYDEIKEDDRLATFNPATGIMEFQPYTARIKRRHDGDMCHFHGKKVDVLVTPNHRMWLAQSRSHGGGYHDFGIIEAQDVKKGYFYKLRCVADWVGKELKTISVLGHEMPAETYMRILGHLVAEGCIHYKNINNYKYKVGISQNLDQNELIFGHICQSMVDLARFCGKHLGTYDHRNTKGFSVNKPSEMRNWTISSKELAAHFAAEIGTNSHDKHLPRWVFDLSPRLLRILLDAATEGDGTVKSSKYGTESVGIRYTTVSKQLADDIQEIAFRCGYAPIMRRDQNGQGKWFWAVDWSNTSYGHFPTVYGNRKAKRNGGGATFERIPYNGDVFCFEVPNGLLVVRRNGHISIQGNCKFAQADDLINPITLVKIGGTGEGEFHPDDAQLEAWRNVIEEAQYDKNFKIVTHAGVVIERVGSSGAVLDISQDMDLIIKNIMWGLMVPHAVIDTESAVYASASIGLEVLRQRYFNFRNMIAKWLTNKIFSPISDLQGFYRAEAGYKKLIVPEVEWNHMNLYDLQDYISNVSSLVTAKQVSLQTLYRSLGLNYEEERQKMRKEAINDAVRQREEQALSSMSLLELRSLDPEREIMESTQAAQPMGGPSMGAPGAPGSDMGAPPMGGGAPPMGGGGGGLPGGLPELAPPPGEAMAGPGGAGAPPPGGATPPLGPGGPGAPPAGPGK